MELSELQKDILNKQDDKIVIMAAAASGKTRMTIEKIRQVLKSGVDPTKIVVITHTNLAAEEVRIRLGDDYNPMLTVSTIHSYANQLLKTAGIDTSAIRSEEHFDEFFVYIKASPRCIKPVEWLFLDEAQDCSEIQYEFIFNMINPTNFWVVGDLRQSIYNFDDGHNPDLFKDLSEREDVKCYSLNENYRNGNQILMYAKRIISMANMSDDSICMNEDEGDTQQLILSVETLRKLFQFYPNLYQWCFIGRSKREIAYFKDILTRIGIPFSTFKRIGMTVEALKNELAKNTVKILTPHAAKGLEFEIVLEMGCSTYSVEEAKVYYVAITRAKSLFIHAKLSPEERVAYRRIIKGI